MEEVASKASKPPPYGRSALPGTQAQDPFIQAHIKELNGAVGNNNNNNNDNSYTNDKQLLAVFMLETLKSSRRISRLRR